MKKYSWKCKWNKTGEIQMEIKYYNGGKKYRNGNKMDMRLHVWRSI